MTQTPLRVLQRDRSLVEAVLLRRFKRFLADVELADGSVETVHCVNTGAMEGLTNPGSRVWLSKATNPDRKTRYTWELVEVGGVVYGANTSFANEIVGGLLRAGELTWLLPQRGPQSPASAALDLVRAEVPYGDRRRIDFLLARGRRELLLEVKNCHLLYPDRRAYFPDSTSERASHHLAELALARTRRRGAAVLFVCQMSGARSIRPSDVHDPVFAQTAREVRGRGVRFYGIAVEHTPTEIRYLGKLPVELKPYGLRRIEGWRQSSA